MTPTTPSPISDQAAGEREALKERLMEAIADALGDALDCTRTWNAWSAGTMSDRDFVEVRGDADRLGEIADAALGVLSTAPTTGSAPDIPAIKGAWIDGGYVIVTPTGTGNAPALKAAILALSSAPASSAASVLSDEQISAIVDEFDACHWVDGECRIDGRDMMKLCRALLAASMGGEKA